MALHICPPTNTIALTLCGPQLPTESRTLFEYAATAMRSGKDMCPLCVQKYFDRMNLYLDEVDIIPVWMTNAQTHQWDKIYVDL